MTALAENHNEPEPSVHLVPTGGDGLPTADDFARGERALEAVRDAGDAETLHAASVEAQAHSLYHQRHEHKAAADGFARLKVLAEAGLGAIDIKQSQPSATGGRTYGKPFTIGGRSIATNQRNAWRLLAIGEMRGMLRETIDELAGDPDGEVMSYMVVQRLRDKRARWVPVGPLVDAIRQSGLSGAEISRRLGYRGRYQCLDPNARVVSFEKASAIAEVLDMDPTALPRTALKWVSRDARRRATERRRAGREALVREQRREAAKTAGGSLEKAWNDSRRAAASIDAAWRDSHRGTKRRAALSEAYEAQRKVEDVLAQALGVE